MKRTRRQRRLSRKRGGANGNMMNVNMNNRLAKANRNANRNANNNYGNFMRRLYNENNKKLDCDAEGFTNEMVMTNPLEYNILGVPGHHPDLHMNGETWSFDKLVDYTMNHRIINWYIKKLTEQGIVFTEEDIQRIKSNEMLKILGAFFHRYKIVVNDRLGQVQDLFNEGVAALLPLVLTRNNKNIKLAARAPGDPPVDPKFKGRNSYQKLLNAQLINPGSYPADIISRLAKIAEENGDNLDFPLNEPLHKAQCLMFYIVKHKGELPPGFVMDNRIVNRAGAPIKIENSLLLIKAWFNQLAIPLEEKVQKRLNAMIDWLEFLVSESKELSNPPVTFGVF